MIVSNRMPNLVAWMAIKTAKYKISRGIEFFGELLFFFWSFGINQM